jgi:hypothetical protein
LTRPIDKYARCSNSKRARRIRNDRTHKTCVDGPATPDNERKDFNPTREGAVGLISDALQARYDEPEPLVTLLLILFDNVHNPELEDRIREMMKAAFDNSIVHSIVFDEYLEALRQGRNPLEEARARLLPEPGTESKSKTEVSGGDLENDGA